jgi:aspartate/methionine/tyrosine aminotransferase
MRLSPTLQLVNELERARAQGGSAWSLSTPTFPAAGPLPQIDDSWIRLTPPMGLPDLREAAGTHFFGHWDLPGHTTVITAGAKAALFATLRAAMEPGARVMVPTPSWPSYIDVCAAARLNAVSFETFLADDFALDIERLRHEAAACNAQAVMLSNPCNPTGRILRAAEIAALSDLCQETGMLLILDQSFSGIVFDADLWRRSVVPVSDRLVLIDSFSKNHILQGARVGCAALPDWLAETFVTVHQSIVSAAPTPGQKLALHALDTGRAMPSLAAQRGLAADFITRLGWRCHMQAGTFYFFPQVPDIDAFRARARAQEIFLLTGEAFGAGYGQHFRLCFGKPEAELLQILELLSEPDGPHARA